MCNEKEAIYIYYNIYYKSVVTLTSLTFKILKCLKLSLGIK